jgi:hypothetical protein
MHLKTSEKQFQVVEQGDRVEAQKQKLLDYIAQEQSHVVLIDNKLVDPTNSTKQLGNYMESSLFEKKLVTILPPSCFFLDNPWKAGFRAVVRRASISTWYVDYETLCPYERGILPEHSVMQLVEKEIPDPDVISRRKSISRKDLGRFEFKKGEGYIFDERDVKPGYKRIKQLGREVKRGWRTILLKLVIANVITLTDAERVFGAPDDIRWAAQAGKQKLLLPW